MTPAVRNRARSLASVNVATPQYSNLMMTAAVEVLAAKARIALLQSERDEPWADRKQEFDHCPIPTPPDRRPVIRAVSFDDVGAAIGRLLIIAMPSTRDAETGASAKLKDFLLAWWNGLDCGHFPILHLCNVGGILAEDMLKIMAYLAQRSTVYADAWGHRDAMRALLWDGDDLEGGVAGERFLTSRSVSIAGGTNEMQRNIISERLLNLPRQPSFAWTRIAVPTRKCVYGLIGKPWPRWTSAYLNPQRHRERVPLRSPSFPVVD